MVVTTSWVLKVLVGKTVPIGDVVLVESRVGEKLDAMYRQVD